MYKPFLICGFLSRAFHFATKSSQLVAESGDISISISFTHAVWRSTYYATQVHNAKTAFVHLH